MGCPPEVSKMILKILERGLIRIRLLGWSGQADLCAIEADHIHHLPDLLANFSRERLVYYWEIGRTAYIAQVPEEQRTVWDSLWEGLQPHVDLMNASTSTV